MQMKFEEFTFRHIVTKFGQFNGNEIRCSESFTISWEPLLLNS